MSSPSLDDNQKRRSALLSYCSAAEVPTVQQYIRYPPKIWCEQASSTEDPNAGVWTALEWCELMYSWVAMQINGCSENFTSPPRFLVIDDYLGRRYVQLHNLSYSSDLSGQMCAQAQGSPFSCTFEGRYNDEASVRYSDVSWSSWENMLREQVKECRDLKYTHGFDMLDDCDMKHLDRVCESTDDPVRDLFVKLLLHALFHEVGHALMHRHFFWIQIVGVRLPVRQFLSADLLPIEVRHRLEFEADDFATMHLLKLGCSETSAEDRDHVKGICLSAALAMQLLSPHCASCRSHPSLADRARRIRATVAVNTTAQSG